MTDLNFGLEEIVEYSIIASILLLIGGAILYVSDTDHIRAQASATQLSYISTLITNNEQMRAQISYDQTRIEEQNYKIIAKIDESSYSKNYFGEKISIKQEDANTYQIIPQNE